MNVQIYSQNDNIQRVELCVHTNKSLLGGVTSAADYISLAAEMEQRALAITDSCDVRAFRRHTAQQDHLKISKLYMEWKLF